MTSENIPIENIARYPLEVLICENLRGDGIVKPFEQWPTAHLLHLEELCQQEIKSR